MVYDKNYSYASFDRRHVFQMGFAYDCVNSVLAAGFDDPLDALERQRGETLA
jgi:hypothetical protein